ncbi:MAG TPA: alpha/beta hydrolase [Thermoanaerobaculia bacterium]|nr:alpha/beta hydrolase [Thermoanaerobaculia bacterium]
MWLSLFSLVAAFAVFAYLRPLTIIEALVSARLRIGGFRTQMIRVGPHNIRVLVGGEGPPLVLVQGIASKANDWVLILPQLAREHRVYAIDLLGYGGSDKPKDADYSIALQTDIVRGAMDALHLGNADVMGLSMGGWISLKLASEYPERVRRLVVISSPGLPYRTSFSATTFTPTTIEGMRASMALQTDRKLPAFVLRDLIRRRTETRYVVESGMRAMLAMRDSMEGKLDRITMPTLLVAGTKDRIVPFAITERMQREIPHAQFVRLEGCGHLGVFECRDRALPAIEAFLHSS